MKMSIAMLSALASFIVVGCTPRIEVAAPETADYHQHECKDRA
ncbi:conserved domain protein [Salmonella enterica subsp. enterica]|uniref:Conserved domain protein n=1 Tax=Salmonella enterica I TaxID=59201 RepID=A0A3S4GLY3_SALET|nr:conserved domain protein [Salmonella enterica subsp. enterica]